MEQNADADEQEMQRVVQLAQRQVAAPDFSSLLEQLHKAQEQNMDLVQDLEKRKLEIELTLQQYDRQQVVRQQIDQAVEDEKPVAFELDDLDARIRKELDNLYDEGEPEEAPASAAK